MCTPDVDQTATIRAHGVGLSDKEPQALARSYGLPVPNGSTSDDAANLERRFDAAMMEIYERAAAEIGYRPTRYLQMLRRRGGLETAHRLLGAKLTSDGYARLREEGRLDLTVEAYAMRAEFQPLFSLQELAAARSRLGYYEQLSEQARSIGGPTDPRLLQLLDSAAAATPAERIKYRDPVAAFGPAAIPAVEAWAAEGGSIGFASAVLEAIGRRGEPTRAVRALSRLKAAHQEWASIIAGAIARIEE